MKITPVTLEGSHVRLEPLSLDHLDGLCEVGLDPSIWRWSPEAVTTREAMRTYIETALAWQRSGTALPFATIHGKSNTAIGSTRFAAIDVENRRTEIGWTWIAPRWQRTAVNTEAKHLMLRHAFETWGCIRVEMKTDALNESSRRAMLRIGAREEGTLRRHMVTADGRYRDSVYYSILDTEWPSRKAWFEEKLG